MDYYSYLFVICIWVVYLSNNIYLNYKMKCFLPRKRIEEIFFAPMYIFILALSTRLTLSLQGRESIFEELIFNDFLIFFLKYIGIIFCLAAVSIFIYVIYFEESFPSCITIQRGVNLRGVYNYIRHPSYAVFFLLTFGTVFYLNDLLLFVLACVNHISLYFFYLLEERRFLKKFPQHQEYIKKTKRFLPTFPKKK